jgi:hypothetical protein
MLTTVADLTSFYCMSNFGEADVISKQPSNEYNNWQIVFLSQINFGFDEVSKVG